MDSRHQRQSFLGKDVQEVATATEATIVGLCGGGSHVAQQLAHVGIGNLNLVDHDRAEVHNGNRMVGLTDEEARRAELKVDVITRHIQGIKLTSASRIRKPTMGRPGSDGDESSLFITLPPATRAPHPT